MEPTNKSISKLSSQEIVWSSKRSKVTPFKKDTIKRLYLLVCSTWRSQTSVSLYRPEASLLFQSKLIFITLFSTFKIQYYLTTPEPDLTPPPPPPNNNNNGGSPVIDLNNQNGTTDGNFSSNATKPATFDESYYYVTDTDSGSGGGTAIVIIIAVLIIIIPLCFVISCIVKKIKERRNKDKPDGLVQLPDHSQNVSSPERPLPGGNLYPFSSPIDD
jgi:hypothetical protein